MNHKENAARAKPGEIWITNYYGRPTAVRLTRRVRGLGWCGEAMASGKPATRLSLRELAEPDWRAHIERLRAEQRAEAGLPPSGSAPAAPPAPPTGHDDHGALDDPLACLSRAIGGITDQTIAVEDLPDSAEKRRVLYVLAALDHESIEAYHRARELE